MKTKHLAYFWASIVMIIWLDALTKYGYIHIFWEERIETPLGFLYFLYIQNPGIAFWMPIEGIFLKIMTLCLIFSIIVYYIYWERKKNIFLCDVGYALIIAWALGNAWERVFLGSVTDFIGIKGFAIFNLADIAITIGAMLLILYTWQDHKT